MATSGLGPEALSRACSLAQGPSAFHHLSPLSTPLSTRHGLVSCLRDPDQTWVCLPRQGPLPKALPARGSARAEGYEEGRAPVRDQPASGGYRGRRRSWVGQRKSSLRTQEVLNPQLLTSSPFSPCSTLPSLRLGQQVAPEPGAAEEKEQRAPPSCRTSLSAPGFSSASVHSEPPNILQSERHHVLPVPEDTLRAFLPSQASNMSVMK